MRRRFPPRTKNPYKPYKNKFEYDIAQVLKGYDYEDKKRKVEYHTEAVYNPDFTLKNKDWLIIEAKGRFMGGSKEAAKYVWVKRCNPTYEIVFIFTNQNNKAYPGCKRRQDGSFLTMGEWAAKNGFLSFSAKHLPPWLIDGSITKQQYYDSLNKQRAYFGFNPLDYPLSGE